MKRFNLEKLDEGGRKIIELVKSFKFKPSEFIVMGGATLEIFGLRKSHDLDILVSENLFNELRYKSGVEYFTKNNSNGDVLEILWTKEAEFYKTTWSMKTAEDLLKEKDDIVIVDEVYCANLESLLRVKKLGTREKDINDVELIEGFLLANTHYFL
jgi:predicted nucleic acid-binding protein